MNFRNSQYYFNRELSWLEFNNRVLHESFDFRTPLLERLKFSAIFSSNLDEFFMIRVSTLKEQVEAQVSQLTPDGLTPQQQLTAIDQTLRPQVMRQHQHFQEELRPQLAAAGVQLLDWANLNVQEEQYLQTHFQKHIYPILTPLSVDPAHPFPLMANLSLNLAVAVKNPRTAEKRFVRIKVPDILPRFICLSEESEPTVVWKGIAIEDVITQNLAALFPGMIVEESCCFRVTRDGDFPVREDDADDLLLAIQQEINKRHFQGFAVRLELQKAATPFLKETLMRGLSITESDVYELNGLLNLKDLMSFLALPLPDMKDAHWTPVIPPRLAPIVDLANESDSQRIPEEGTIFHAIRQGDILVHHPYESFEDTVQLFITQAATDPQVLAIKITLYRTSGDSPIVQALMDAAASRKQVVALVELKARFDEASNITWAKHLEAAGVHVVYGVIGLKTHTKTVLVLRQEGKVLRRYFHIGTGNYNPKTAKLYTDLGLLSCREGIGADLTELFNFLTGFAQQPNLRALLIAPVNLRQRLQDLIYREIEHAKNGKDAHIIAKMNALADPQLIATLYEASIAGVQIDLIVRGVCCLRPGIADISENIRVISIIGSYLEHSRIFYFHNDGQSESFIGSADWMPRNLDRRVEVVTPIYDPIIGAQLKEILDVLMADNSQAWELRSDGHYVQRHPAADEPIYRSQAIFQEKMRGEKGNLRFN
jgi:polyphosphate kinase